MNVVRLFFHELTLMFTITFSFTLLALTRNQPHVHLMHIDGAHGQIIKRMMEEGQLPHLKSLLTQKGKISFETVTVDKSETMKVIPSYLSSQVNQKTVGWWQFERNRYQYNNTWIEPLGVANYALGLEGPLYPTLFDLLTDPEWGSTDSHQVLSGFALMRRWIAFEDYARNYVEGLDGAFNHQYLKQLEAVTDNIIQFYRSSSKRPLKQFPVLFHSLLASADEYCHLYGVTTDKIRPPRNSNETDAVDYCFYQGEFHGIFDTLFNWSQKFDKKVMIRGHHYQSIYSPYWPRTAQYCLKLPLLQTASSPSSDIDIINHQQELKVIHPAYALGLIAVDISLGRILSEMKELKLPGEAESGDSIFDRTLFFIFGDHGMVDSKAHMAPLPPNQEEYERNPLSEKRTLLMQLSDNLGLKIKSPDEKTKEGELLVIDDKNYPIEMKYPYSFLTNQNNAHLSILPIRKIIKNSSKLAKNLWEAGFTELDQTVMKRYYWLSFLRYPFIRPKLEKLNSEYGPKVRELITKISLSSRPEYLQWEKEYLHQFFNNHIRLVYGGGALNNLELFLPGTNPITHQLDWEYRPTINEIQSAFNGKLFHNFLRQNPAIDLLFIRKENELFTEKNPLPRKLTIIVMNRIGHQGELEIFRDPTSKEFIIGYRTLSSNDPLKLNDLNLTTNPNRFTYKTYHQWMNASVINKSPYINVTAGIATYLFSNNPAIGDLLAMHSQGWNFGDNSGGHGGVHREEKLTFLLVSGYGVKNNYSDDKILKTTVPTQIENPNDPSTVANKEWKSVPSLLDIAPTVLYKLGYSPMTLTKYARSGKFKNHFQNWLTQQRLTLHNDLLKVPMINQVLKEQGLNGFNVNSLSSFSKNLMDFIPSQIPTLPDYSEEKEMGFILDI